MKNQYIFLFCTLSFISNENKPKSSVKTAIEWIKIQLGMKERNQQSQQSRLVSQLPSMNTIDLKEEASDINNIYVAILQNKPIFFTEQQSKLASINSSLVNYAIRAGRIQHAIELVHANYPITEQDCHLAELLNPNNPYLNELYNTANEKSSHPIISLKHKENIHRSKGKSQNAAISKTANISDLILAAQKNDVATMYNLVIEKGVNITDKDNGVDVLEVSTAWYNLNAFKTAINLGAPITEHHAEFLLLRYETIPYAEDMSEQAKKQNMQALHEMIKIIEQKKPNLELSKETQYILALLRSSTAMKPSTPRIMPPSHLLPAQIQQVSAARKAEFEKEQQAQKDEKIL